MAHWMCLKIFFLFLFWSIFCQLHCSLLHFRCRFCFYGEIFYMCIFPVLLILSFFQSKNSIHGTKKTTVSWTTCLTETVLLLILLLIIPMALIMIELMFAYGTQHIPPDMLELMWRWEKYLKSSLINICGENEWKKGYWQTSQDLENLELSHTEQLSIKYNLASQIILFNFSLGWTLNMPRN